MQQKVLLTQIDERRELLSNLRMHVSLSRVVLNKYYEDSVQVFGAYTGFF
jgi:hypothetical protein